MASTYSPTLKRAVPSALTGLTSLFGMGRGGPCCYRHPKRLISLDMPYRMIEANNNNLSKFWVVSFRVISTTRLWHYCLYTCSLSTPSSTGALKKKSHLEVSFVLRCFQRLSHPYIATLRCGWRHNRYTRGMSTPVLSY